MRRLTYLLAGFGLYSAASIVAAPLIARYLDRRIAAMDELDANLRLLAATPVVKLDQDFIDQAFDEIMERI